MPKLKAGKLVKKKNDNKVTLPQKLPEHRKSPFLEKLTQLTYLLWASKFRRHFPSRFQIFTVLSKDELQIKSPR